MSFRIITDEERKIYSPELVGSQHIIISDDTKFWIVKQSDGLKRELLGYLLGRHIANVAEIKKLNAEEHAEIKLLTGKDDSSTPENTFLVRLAGSYLRNELLHKTPEEAVAAELVFSTWIRRRDAHVDNRVYVEGIPIFYDHGVAFLLEPDRAHITIFFKSNNDYGHASFWRVKEIAGPMTTNQARSVDKSVKGAYHYVNDIKFFRDKVKIMEKYLRDNLPSFWKNYVYEAGFQDREAEIICGFLNDNLRNLSNDLQNMEEVIFKA